MDIAERGGGPVIRWDRFVAPTILGGRTASSVVCSADSQNICLLSVGFIANRSELIKRYGWYAAATDQELLLNLYRLYGIRATEFVVGPFAWVVWDVNRQILVAARDRVGIQSIYYVILKNIVQIAGDVQSLLRSLLPVRTFNLRSIVAHINSQPLLDGETYYEEIKSVEPGKILTIARDNIEVTRYWHIEPQPLLQLATDTKYADAYRNLLFQVVAEYVPKCSSAVALSGGMDSTSVAAAIRAVAPNADLTAISWISPELPESDESQYASLVSRFLNIPAYTIRADRYWTMCSSEGIKTSEDKPFYHPYTELWHETFSKLRQHDIGVLFSGVGGDQMFDGDAYSYPDLMLTGRWLEMIRQLRRHRADFGTSIAQIIKKMIVSPILHAYFPPWRNSNTQEAVPWLRSRYVAVFQEYSANMVERHPVLMLPGRQARFGELRIRGLLTGIELLDSAASEYMVEFRHPLLDHRLFTFAASLPTNQTFRANWRKIIVRNAMDGYLPYNVINWGGRIVASSIAHRGLREREQPKVWQLITNMRSAELGLVDEKVLQATYRDYLAGKHEYASFWNTLTLEDWLRRYF